MGSTARVISAALISSLPFVAPCMEARAAQASSSVPECQRAASRNASAASSLADDAVSAALTLLDQRPEKCDKAKRESQVENLPSCCTQEMVATLAGYRAKALPRIQAAIRALGAPSGHAKLLKKHFRVSPSDSDKIATIRSRLYDMYDSMSSAGAVKYLCRDRGDVVCPRNVQGHTEGGYSGPQPNMMFCMDYGSGGSLEGKEFFRTFIHEHAHSGARVVNDIVVGYKEVYSFDDSGRYPPPAEVAVRNADSYAAFILELDGQ